jgi:hypothetical protein
LAKVNGRRIEESLSRTIDANSGRGFQLTPQVISREVPAAEATFTIVGRTHHAAPILSVFNAVYEVSGEVKFAPLPAHFYMVKGELNDSHSVVWLEDSNTGDVVGSKIEIQGSARLGILEK